ERLAEEAALLLAKALAKVGDGPEVGLAPSHQIQKSDVVTASGLEPARRVNPLAGSVEQEADRRLGMEGRLASLALQGPMNCAQVEPAHRFPDDEHGIVRLDRLRQR